MIVRVEFSFDGEVDDELHSWLTTALVSIGAHDIFVTEVA